MTGEALKQKDISIVKENPEDIFANGSEEGKVPVSIGPRFLNLFSEHLYTSPNKAFEELVSNSWDAGAENVYIKIPEDLEKPNAALWIIDDGHSMDFNGLKQLWSVATSFKRQTDKTPEGRNPIGKFGVGKLATYLLADRLTYICKAPDGIIRSVTMDYRRIDEMVDKQALHIDNMDLSVRILDETELAEFINIFEGGKDIVPIIGKKIAPITENIERFDEFGGAAGIYKKLSQDTWTIAVLTNLKPGGKAIKDGWIRYILSTALPLGDTIKIKLNNEVLSSKKASIDTLVEWTIGPDLNIEGIDVDGEEIKITSGKTPYPYLEVTGIGKITGTVKLYKESIAGGKSNQIELSNGFQINILGRVVRLDDPYFGLENLHHTTWARFRASVRADGLDDQLSVNRDDISRTKELRIFQAILRKLFNIARSVSKDVEGSRWPQTGDIITRKWGEAPLEPLEKVVEQSLESLLPLPGFLGVIDATKRGESLNSWRKQVERDPGKIIRDVIISEDVSKDSRLVSYSIDEQKIIINANHPFALEHSEDELSKKLLSDTALVDLLTNAYAVSIGITTEQLEDIETYRDRAYRLIAQTRRQSASQIASLLAEASNHVKGFETIVGDALAYLGFAVKRMGGSGEPEGVATAFLTPKSDGQPDIYRLTYDAKSTVKKAVQTGNVNIAGLQRHREEHEAQYALVVAPQFQAGALITECAACGVTPIQAEDLSTLLLLTIGHGPINLDKLREMFALHDPKEVHKWVESLRDELENRPTNLTMAVLIEAFDNIIKQNPDSPDRIHTSVVASECRKILKNSTNPSRNEIRAVINGLQLMIPNIISIDSAENIILNTNPHQITHAIKIQLKNIASLEAYGIIKGISK